MNAFRVRVAELHDDVVLDRRRMTPAERDELRERLAHDLRPIGPLGFRLVELLPHSRMVWWENGAPAHWRRRTRRSG